MALRPSKFQAVHLYATAQLTGQRGDKAQLLRRAFKKTAVDVVFGRRIQRQGLTNRATQKRLRGADFVQVHGVTFGLEHRTVGTQQRPATNTNSTPNRLITNSTSSSVKPRWVRVMIRPR